MIIVVLTLTTQLLRQSTGRRCMRNKAEIVTRTKAAPRHAGYQVDLHPVQNCCKDFAPFLHRDCCGNGGFTSVAPSAWAPRGGGLHTFLSEA